MDELRKYYAVVEVPINRAVNRDLMIEELQDKFKYSKPKKYGQKPIDNPQVELDLDE